jgi:hypothetical protein
MNKSEMVGESELKLDGEIELCFSEERLTEHQKKVHAVLRNKAKELAYLTKELVPDGNEQLISINALEACVSGSRAGIIRRTIAVGVGHPPEIPVA